MEKEYRVKTKFVFVSNFYVKAENKPEAKEFIEKHYGLVIGGGDVNSTLPDEDIDWDFGCSI